MEEASLPKLLLGQGAAGNEDEDACGTLGALLGRERRLQVLLVSALNHVQRVRDHLEVQEHLHYNPLLPEAILGNPEVAPQDRGLCEVVVQCAKRACNVRDAKV